MVFPVRDVLTPRTTPVATWGLLAFITVFQCVWFALGIDSPMRLVEMAATALVVFVFGENVEDQLGHGRFPVFFAACGAAGALAVLWVTTGRFTPMAVVTGGVAGVMGGYFAMFPFSRLLVRLPFSVIELPAVFLLALWLLLQAIGPSPAAAVAGLLTGAALIRLFRLPERARWEWREH